ncbi:GNAT family N-acetyltransferase [Dyadobacter pollutisoli]|uniref:GNAT family N-acetyltransferase n=1 Tax=Dyadobacter pollutisoli TaxID=2910158 RepID=A0A9E8NEM7_9BACT|nr:GNAT family N-acetyltransferase [Dyadobacter pollutisoli]WAC12912.1 GNAT family N-acetyltransferase [Dyadobacter pollutisoli]
MTPVLLNRTEINDARWDQLIGACRQGVVYAHTFYLDIVCCGWKALVWPDRSNYQIVMPLPVVKKWGKTIVFQPLFCQYLGVFSMGCLGQTDFLAFMQALSSHFSYVSSYHFNPENFNTLFRIKDQLAEFTFTPQHTFWLNLCRAYGEIYGDYSPDRKVNVRRGRSSGWTIEKNGQITPLIELFVANQSRRIAGGVRPGAYDLLKNIFAETQMRGIGQVCYAKKDNQVHAGTLVVRYAGRAIYLFNASDAVGRKNNARSCLLDMYFSGHAEEHLVFDFESPEVPAIAGFYKSFGAHSIPYFKISKNQLWFPFRQIQNWRVRYFQNQVKSLRRPL